MQQILGTIRENSSMRKRPTYTLRTRLELTEDGEIVIVSLPKVMKRDPFHFTLYADSHFEDKNIRWFEVPESRVARKFSMHKGVYSYGRDRIDLRTPEHLRHFGYTTLPASRPIIGKNEYRGTQYRQLYTNIKYPDDVEAYRFQHILGDAFGAYCFVRYKF